MSSPSEELILLLSTLVCLWSDTEAGDGDTGCGWRLPGWEEVTLVRESMNGARNI